MRDGNKKKAPRARGGVRARLKPTYEGWKPSYSGGFCRKIRCLKPTYEGWKLNEFIQFFFDFFMFEAYL